MIQARNLDFSTFDRSTTEKVVGKWIDGKDLYERVVKIDNPVIGSTENYPHGISNFNFGYVEVMVAKRQSSCRSMNYTYTTSAYAVSQINEFSVSYRIPTEWGWNDVEYIIAIVRYTKTS